RHAQEEISRSHGHVDVQTVIDNPEQIHYVTRHKCCSSQLTRIPGCQHESTGMGVLLNLGNDITNLIDANSVAANRISTIEVAPLEAITRPEFTFGIVAQSNTV